MNNPEGVIGVGLFVGTAEALRDGGPLGLFLGYALMSSVCYATMVRGHYRAFRTYRAD